MRLIIRGAQGVGKTTLISNLVNQLQPYRSVSGLITLVQWHNGIRSGYILQDLATKALCPFANINHFPNAIKVGRFFVYPSALEFGLNVLFKSLPSDILIIDEVGRWELNGAGWSPFLQHLSLNKKPRIEIWGVGDKNVEAVQTQWVRKNDVIINAMDARIETILPILLHSKNEV